MTVADFQEFIRRMGQVLDVSGAKKTAGELASFADSLEQFRAKSLNELRALWEKGQADGGAVGRKPAAAGLDESKVQAALEKVSGLHARALDPNVNSESVAAVLAPIGANLNAKELDELARRFGILKKQGSKAKVVKAISDRILAEKGNYARANE